MALSKEDKADVSKAFGKKAAGAISTATNDSKNKAIRAKMKPGIHRVGKEPSRFVHKGKQGDIDLYETWKGGKQHIQTTK